MLEIEDFSSDPLEIPLNSEVDIEDFEVFYLGKCNNTTLSLWLVGILFRVLAGHTQMMQVDAE